MNNFPAASADRELIKQSTKQQPNKRKKYGIEHQTARRPHPRGSRREKEVKKGGIIIPDTAKEKPQEGIVRVLGTGKLDDDGKRIAFEVKVGDRVLVSKYGARKSKLTARNTRFRRG